ncbi:dephospho-CoA kinase [Fructilactobacillus myrtifloralis]|uniref:Dephospho-CoA kinase n=1 Tax=Fructilactobacillus myrtifloralis TaxID=2940301 RepID=A0ABY5BS87_9LACO|nr:dephospho-CoA kinase [Fructilactobacillus myrtifloralis]USS85239.1 dephospho-CoA kinase [Fructilactobacillus myrtifloralis]
MTKVIGLTGGIATGKSTAARYLVSQGVAVLDLDAETHELEAHDQATIQQITATFGPEVQVNGQIDRHRLGQLVFADSTQLKRLVRIINPALLRRVTAAMAESDLLVLDAPTLFENGFTSYVDQILMVTCEPLVQMQRLITRNQVSISRASQLMGAQWSQATKAALADWVVDSTAGETQLTQQLQTWLEKMR